jgi:hypothetical protein
MPIKPHNQDRTASTETSEQVLASIGAQVLHSLGPPGDLQRVQVLPLWTNHFRVNILIGKDVTAARIAHSYFLVVDGDGKIIQCAPRVVRSYS